MWLSGWSSLLSPPPLQPCPIPATHRTHLKWFAYRADTCHWLARCKQPASGLPYQWRQCYVSHRERTSCFTTLLLFLLQTAAIALSFFFSPPPPLLSLWDRGVGLTSGPHLQIVSPPSECTVDYSPFPLLLSIFLLIFIGYWDHNLFGCNYGRCQLNPVSLRLVMNYSPPLAASCQKKKWRDVSESSILRYWVFFRVVFASVEAASSVDASCTFGLIVSFLLAHLTSSGCLNRHVTQLHMSSVVS